MIHWACYIGALLAAATAALIAYREGLKEGVRRGYAAAIPFSVTSRDIERLGGILNPTLPKGSITADQIKDGSIDS